MAVDRSQQAALDRLIVETRLLFRALRGAAERVHGEGAQTAARRSILLELVQEGPRTVPAMAEARHVSRQAVQGLVDALEQAHLVERTPNPEHKRSWLWAATDLGTAKVDAMRSRERAALGALDGAPVAAHLDEASRVLREVRRAVDEADYRPNEGACDPASPRHAETVDTMSTTGIAM